MLYSVSGICIDKDEKRHSVIYDIWAANEDDAILYFKQLTVGMVNSKYSDINITEVTCDHKTTMPPYFIIRENKQQGGYDILNKRINRKAKVCEFWVVSPIYHDLNKATFDLYGFINNAIPPLLNKQSQYIAYSI